MGSLIVISWRDIPAQVIVKRGREAAKVQLSHRFQEAVDRAGGTVVLQNATDGHHRDYLPLRSTRSCWAASYRVRAAPERRRICSICGSRDVLHQPNPYSTANSRQPASPC